MSRAQSVFEQLGFSKEENRVLELKTKLLGQVLDLYREKELNQTKLAKLWGKSAPRVNEILRGRLHLVSVDTMIDLLGVLGQEVEVRTRPRGSKMAWKEMRV